ncbi:MAG: adenylate/guanylate cyclase domain-containing protein [bacterium]|nr:adenylate/guanylate cyclase domain-containing protein [bacterium]
MSRALLMKFRQCGLSIAFFIGISLLLFFNDSYFRTAPDLIQTNEYPALENMFTYLMGGLMGGVLFCAFEFFLLENLFSRFGLLVLTAGRAAVLMAIYFTLSISLSLYYNMNLSDQGPLSPEVLNGVTGYISSPIFVINMVFYSIFAVILIYFHQIATIVGRGVLGKFLFARYKKPRIVKRVFLFMDVNSSTSIAEEIGHERFFALIQDFLVESGKEILEHGGEIYKYVGDEIIAVWPVREGGEGAQAMACLFAIRARIASRADYFRDRYGHVPEFKSALHVGEAMTGELGEWKREIAYMGDVLNTTARIQGACKKAGAWLLISQDYRDLVQNDAGYEFQLIGRGRLRGKDQPIALYRVEQAAK